MKPRRWSLAVAFMVVALLAPRTALTAVAAGPLDGLPRYDHVFVLVEENESVDATYGPAGAPYLKQLAAQGVFDDHYYATGHLS
ncbi:MAG: phosphoesterase, partial [Candidatus Dormibacteraeota bacterium]|nr:phosphoesterase [Candidatus Dormibacteraeota bacterium]